jgi:hypothetical protein
MQITLTIALAVAGFALATIPAFAVEMPTDGSKNFSPPSDAPSYFANEAVPEPARVDRAADFSREDVAASPDVGQTAEVATEPERHGKHASAYTRHASGKSKGHGGPTRYAKSTFSKSNRTAAQNTATSGGTRSASATKFGTQAGASKAGPTKHARTNTRQHVEAIPAGTSPLAPA